MRQLNLWLVALTLGLAASLAAGEGNEKKTEVKGGADVKALEEKVDKALKGYNDEDYKVFFADYAKTMAALATEQMFKTMYIDINKKNFGKYVSKKAIAKETVTVGDFPLFVYEAEFEKGKVKISVNFTKEGDEFKIMQFRMDKI